MRCIWPCNFDRVPNFAFVVKIIGIELRIMFEIMGNHSHLFFFVIGNGIGKKSWEEIQSRRYRKTPSFTGNRTIHIMCEGIFKMYLFIFIKNFIIFKFSSDCSSSKIKYYIPYNLGMHGNQKRLLVV